MNGILKIVKNQKGFSPIIILVGALIIATVAGGTYYLGTKNSETFQDKLAKQNPNVYSSPGPEGNKPSPETKPTDTDETVNWKTYANAKVGFQIKYPPEYDKNRVLEVFELDEGSNSTALKADDEIWVGFPYSDVVLLALRYYKSDLTALQWWNTEGVARYNKLVTDYYGAITPKPQTLKLPNFSISQTMVAGKEALEAKGHMEAAQRGDITVIIVSNNGGIYLFEYGNPFEGDKDELTSKQILSTFKFTR